MYQIPAWTSPSPVLSTFFVSSRSHLRTSTPFTICGRLLFLSYLRTSSSPFYVRTSSSISYLRTSSSPFYGCPLLLSICGRPLPFPICGRPLRMAPRYKTVLEDTVHALKDLFIEVQKSTKAIQSQWNFFNTTHICNNNNWSV